MPFLTVNENNIDLEHICCAITDAKGENCVASKKAWMRDRFADGLVFLRLDERAKVFIEYIPAEKAWCPIEADGCMHINCFWVSGKYQGQGYANRLLEECIADARAKGKTGLTVIASEKKRSFLSDPGYLRHKGFVEVDKASPYFVLYYLPLGDAEATPRFRQCAKEGSIAAEEMTLFYTSQCPHTAKYAPIIQEIARQQGRTLMLHQIETMEQAQNAPTAFSTYAFFHHCKFVTNEIFSEKKFEKYLAEHPDA